MECVVGPGAVPPAGSDVHAIKRASGKDANAKFKEIQTKLENILTKLEPTNFKEEDLSQWEKEVDAACGWLYPQLTSTFDSDIERLLPTHRLDALSISDDFLSALQFNVKFLKALSQLIQPTLKSKEFVLTFRWLKKVEAMSTQLSQVKTKDQIDLIDAMLEGAKKIDQMTRQNIPKESQRKIKKLQRRGCQLLKGYAKALGKKPFDEKEKDLKERCLALSIQAQELVQKIDQDLIQLSDYFGIQTLVPSAKPASLTSVKVKSNISLVDASFQSGKIPSKVTVENIFRTLAFREVTVVNFEQYEGDLKKVNQSSERSSPSLQTLGAKLERQQEKLPMIATLETIDISEKSLTPLQIDLILTQKLSQHLSTLVSSQNFTLMFAWFKKVVEMCARHPKIDLKEQSKAVQDLWGADDLPGTSKNTFKAVDDDLRARKISKSLKKEIRTLERDGLLILKRVVVDVKDLDAILTEINTRLKKTQDELLECAPKYFSVNFQERNSADEKEMEELSGRASSRVLEYPYYLGADSKGTSAYNTFWSLPLVGGYDYSEPTKIEGNLEELARLALELKDQTRQDILDLRYRSINSDGVSSHLTEVCKKRFRLLVTVWKRVLEVPLNEFGTTFNPYTLRIANHSALLNATLNHVRWQLSLFEKMIRFHLPVYFFERTLFTYFSLGNQSSVDVFFALAEGVVSLRVKSFYTSVSRGQIHIDRSGSSPCKTHT